MKSYRHEIDGLRGISVILVIFFHAKLPFFSGGFFGVDIFFVISGYLITSIILDFNKKDKTFLINFYERRIRRIIPALYVLLVFLVIYSYLFQAPYFSKDLSQSIFFTPIFLQNFLNIYEAANYFNLSYDLKSLGHTWSLSIEEQFYFLYPIIIIFFLKGSKEIIMKLISILFLISLLLYFYGNFNEKHPINSFFFTPSRIWEILFGCILAVKKWKIKKDNFFPSIGMFIILSTVFIQSFFSIEIISRFLVVIGTGFLLIRSYPSQGCFVGKILKSRILIFFGLISYSLYLWHVPVFSIYRDFFSYETSNTENFFLILITIIISFFSYKLIETPFRKGKKFSSKKVYSFFLIGLLVFPIYGYYGHISDGFEKNKIANLKDDKKKYYVSFVEEKKKIEKFKLKKIDSANKIMIIGDSLASDVVYSLNTQNIYAERYSLNGPCFAEIVNKKVACGRNLEDLVATALKSKSVIISSDFINESSENGAIELYKFLKNKKINTKLIGGLNFSYVSSSSFRYAKFNFYEDMEIESFYYKTIQPNTFDSNALLKNKIGSDYIDKFQFICDTFSKKCGMLNNKNESMFYDTKHLTTVGYYKFGEYLKDKI